MEQRQQQKSFSRYNFLSVAIKMGQDFTKVGKNMDVDLIFKIAAIGILVAVLNQVLSRAGRDEQAMMTTLAGLVVVLMMVVQEIARLFALVKSLFDL